MRTKEVLLDDFDNIKIFQQYLYMSEEHFVTVINTLGVELRIRMGANLHYYCKNMNFPNLPDMHYSENMNNEVILGIIEQLKEQPAVSFPKSFSNRWEEIKNITQTNLAKNEMERKCW